MTVNASICTYHTDARQVAGLTGTLRRCDHVDRVWIIDNGEQPRADLACLTPDYVFMGRNAGYGTAHNVAMRRSIELQADYHLVLNADISFSPEALATATAYMDAHADTGLLMPRLRYPDGTLQRACRLLPAPIDVIGRRFLPDALTRKRNRRYELIDTGYDRIMNIPYLSGSFMLLRVSALAEVGLFDERFFMYPEDIDLTRRLHRRYRTIFFPQAEATHDHARGSYHSMRLLWVHIINMIRYFNKWGWLSDPERTCFNNRAISNYIQHNP